MDEAKTSEPLNINVNAKADLQRTILDLETKLVKALRERDEDRAQCAELREALEEIAQGKGRFSLDQQEFANNVIEEAKETACKVLASTDAGKGWVSPEEHGKALNEIEVIAGHAKDMEEELEQVQAEAAAAAAVVRKLTWVDTGTESGRTVFLCATCGCQRNEHHDPGCEILAVENGTAGKSLLAELEKLRAAAKNVVASRSVAYFDSDQLSHIYVSVDGALLVKVREALDALEEKP